MIKSVVVINYRGEALNLNLLNPEDSGYETLDIQGLGPVKATINTSKVSTMDGVLYNSATVDGRNIVIQLGFLNAPTVEEARQRTYQYFPLKKEVTLLIETDTRTVTTTGYVESNEPNIFGIERSTQISIVCENAYFFDASDDNKTKTEFYGTEKGFEFPFSNESLEEPLLEFGQIKGIFVKEVTYPGDVEVGLTISISATGPVENLTIYDPETNRAIRIDHDILESMTGNGIIAGDTIVITTVVGSKSAYLYRSGNRYNILNALGRRPDWLYFIKGRNVFAYNATEGSSNVQITIESYILYEGV